MTNNDPDLQIANTTKANLSATTDPTVNDDSTQGYAIGSVWVNTSTGDIYQCTDDSVGAAVWPQLNGGGSTDPNAIHDNVAGEINAITEKASPVDTDIILIEDSADSQNKKKVQVGNLPSPSRDKCRAYTSSNQSVGTSWTTIPLNAENYDTNSMHDNSTNPSRITIQKDGYYSIIGHIVFDRNQDDEIQLLLNGSTVLSYSREHVEAFYGSGNQGLECSTLEQLSVGDYIEIQARKSGSSTTNAKSGRENTYLIVQEVG